MTISSTLEAKLRERGSSSAPADAAGRVLGVQPRDDAGAARFGTVVHWAYGTSWGAVRGLLHATGIEGGKATAAHFAAVWGSELAMLPALDVAPPSWESEPKEIANRAPVPVTASACGEPGSAGAPGGSRRFFGLLLVPFFLTTVSRYGQAPAAHAAAGRVEEQRRAMRGDRSTS